MFHDGHLLIILHEVPRPGVPERTGLLFWREPEGQWRTSTSGAGLAPLVLLLERYEKTVDDLELRLAAADEAIEYLEILQHGGPLRRAAENLKQALQVARESVSADKRIIALRDQAVDLERACELLLDDTKNALEVAMARQAEHQSRMSHQVALATQRLNRLMALFLPLTAAASLFGMNLSSGVDTSSVAWFWGVIVGGLLLGLLFARTGKVPAMDEPAPRSRSPRAEPAPFVFGASSPNC